MRLPCPNLRKNWQLKSYCRYQMWGRRSLRICGTSIFVRYVISKIKILKYCRADFRHGKVCICSSQSPNVINLTVASRFSSSNIQDNTVDLLTKMIIFIIYNPKGIGQHKGYNCQDRSRLFLAYRTLGVLRTIVGAFQAPRFQALPYSLSSKLEQ